MPGFELTPSQKKAVEAPVMDLLVCAAAGSGKTAVLSKRIVRLLSDENSGADISRLLVVTFTKAAASELRVRIANALDEGARQMRSEGRDREAERMAEQLRKIGLASISTIHSFCYRLVRENFSRLSLPASVRIADEAETQSLMRDCMESAIDELYETDDDFPAFADTLIELRDDRLSDILLGFYLRLIQQPGGLAFAEKSRQMLTEAAEDFDSSPFFSAIREYVEKFSEHYAKCFEIALSDISCDEKASAAYYPAFYRDLSYVLLLSERAKEGYAALNEYLFSYSPERLGTLRGGKSEQIKGAFEMRKEFVQAMKALAKRFSGYSLSEIGDDCIATARCSAKLYDVLTFFDEKYFAQKLRNSVLDYNDLERLSYRLLYDGEGRPSALAGVVSRKFDAVFIDEYQDTNALQDAIFSAISSGNRFMVGDIKQSIYGFRGAMPEIFSEYRNRYPDYKEGAGQSQGKIFLSENFRSDRGVIDFSNRIFECLFNNNSRRVPYMPDDALVCTRRPEDDAGLKTEVCIIRKSGEDGGISEEEYVASRVAALISEGVAPSEIVILLRSMSSSEKFRKALADRFLQCDCPGRDDSLLLYPEVLLLICIVNVIDNPCRDIYLAGVLKSPLFDMSTGQLITIRRQCPAGSLYSALREFCALDRRDQDSLDIFEKAGRFFEWLEAARRYSEMKPADRIVRYLITGTPVIAIAVKNGGRAERIRQFYELARKYESYSYHGLHSFVRYINELSERKPSEQPQAISASELSAVRIMSIHQSKGSEFSYVFLADTAHRFNTSDQNGKLLYEKSLGIGMKQRGGEGYVRYDTIIRQAVSTAIALDNLDEEMRILYVAMTRAKKQLVITASSQRPEEFCRKCSYSGRVRTPWLYMDAASYIEWIALCLGESGNIRIISEAGQPSDRYSQGAEKTKEVRVPSPLGCLLKERLDFEYPKKDFVDLPAKLSVSRLHPGILDDEGAELLRSEGNEFEKTPLFLNERITVSGAQRGTATHLFMQFCDFDRVVSRGVDSEIERLVEKKFITRSAADMIYKKKLRTFFSSRLFGLIRSADRIKREQRFNVRMPAEEFTLDPAKASALSGEEVLVQGVVDLLIFDHDGGITLVDYKTDHISPPPEEQAGTGFAEYVRGVLRERYSAQLTYYARAVQKIYGKKVKQALLYSFELEDTVTVET